MSWGLDGGGRGKLGKAADSLLEREAYGDTDDPPFRPAGGGLRYPWTGLG